MLVKNELIIINIFLITFYLSYIWFRHLMRLLIKMQEELNKIK